jgi:hypothetical protein
MVAMKNSCEIHIETQETKHHMHSLPSWTLRDNHGCRMDPKPTEENLLLHNQCWLQSDTTCHCK